MRESGLASAAEVLFITFLALILLSGIAPATTLTSTFSCDNDNAETTFYSYMKDPNLQESGYSQGLRTGTFNYFKGGHVALEDTIIHYDGTVDREHLNEYGANRNESINHVLTVDFVGDKEAGDKSISEFYAKGYYFNNRVISAGKKIWFIDQIYPSNNVKIDASADLSLRGTFNFRYNVDAYNAYFVFSDRSGWSNRTGSRRTDWEQSGLMKGEHIKVTNDLIASGMSKALAGGDDWLPCCFPSGTIPRIEPIEGNGSEWPSPGVYAMLTPMDLKLTKCALKGNCGSGMNACILSTGEGAAGLAGAPNIPEVPPLRVQSFYKSKGDGFEFTINVRNLAKTDLKEVNLWFKYPAGMDPQTDTATVNGEIQSPDPVGDDQLRWELGTLQPTTTEDGVKTIKIQINKGDSKATTSDSEAFATYRIGGGNPEKTTPVKPTMIRAHTDR